MKLFNIKTKLILFVLIVVSAGCANTDADTKKESRVETLPFYGDASFTPNWLTPNSDDSKYFHKIPSFSLINQDGDTITEQTFKQKIYITDFFFTSCPGICPKMTKNMMILQEEFLEDNEVLLLSHSVTPKRDSVPVLKEYAENKGIVSDKWHLATGTKKQIYGLGRKSYFVEEDLGYQKKMYDFLHTENFVLIDKNRHIRGIYNGLNKTAVRQLIADVRLLQNE